MDEQKLLFVKKQKDISYLCNRTKNPMMLFRWCKHFYLTICNADELLSEFITRNCDFLFPDFRLKLDCLVEAYNQSQPKDVVAYFETFRSDKRQQYVYSTGASSRRKGSMHYYGFACDLVKYLNNKYIWTLDYTTLRSIARELPLFNLYPMEECHFQFIPCSMQNDFRDFANNTMLTIQDLFNVKKDAIIGSQTQFQLRINYQRLVDYFSQQESLIKK